ncbi:MAG: hypothetical protein HFI31_14805 [Lachnospiraceae bacterium]|nr:hypothetical protein [Lachnospiraceae bacterium]
MREIIPGEKFEIAIRVRKGMNGGWRIKRDRYKVLMVYRHFVLCEKISGGYKECFGSHDLKFANRC